MTPQKAVESEHIMNTRNSLEKSVLGSGFLIFKMAKAPRASISP